MAKRNPTSRKPSTKQIRIGTAHYPGGVHFAECEVSYIRLRGHWLSEAGFHPDTLVTIRVRRGRLTLTRA